MIRWWVLGLFNAGCLIWLAAESLRAAGLFGTPRPRFLFGPQAESMAILLIWLVGNLVILTVIFLARRR